MTRRLGREMLVWALGAEERAVEPGAFTVLLVVPQIVALDSLWDFEATSNCYECLRATDCTGLCGAAFRFVPCGHGTAVPIARVASCLLSN